MLVWDDIKQYTKDYSDGIKRIDDKNEVIRKLSGKTKTNNIVHMKELKHDFGLEEKYTIRPFKLKHDPGISKLLSNRATPSHTVTGKSKLSSGSQSALNYLNRFVPKINYKHTDAQLFQHNLKNASNNELIKRQMTNGSLFAKNFVQNMSSSKNGTTVEIIDEDNPFSSSSSSSSSRLRTPDNDSLSQIPYTPESELFTIGRGTIERKKAERERERKDREGGGGGGGGGGGRLDVKLIYIDDFEESPQFSPGSSEGITTPIIRDKTISKQKPRQLIFSPKNLNIPQTKQKRRNR